MNIFAKAAARVLLACGLAATLQATAQGPTFPNKPIRLIVPSAAGGGYDTMGRVVADRVSQELPQPVVVENRPGAGLVGTRMAATAAPDGYTLLVGGIANIAFPAGLYNNLGFNPADMVCISLVGSFGYTLIARKELQVTTLRQVLDHARANPGKLSFASAGPGSGQHVAAALMASLAGVELLHVPYKGAQPAYTDILGGRVDLFFDNTATVRPFVQDGRVQAIATSSRSRDSLLPEVPTGPEAGLPGLELESWIGVFAPANTPAAVVAQLRAAVQKAMQTPEALEKLRSAGFRPLTLSDAETQAYLRSENQKWPAFLRKAGMRTE